jgi:hypothetical protein
MVKKSMKRIRVKGLKSRKQGAKATAYKLEDRNHAPFLALQKEIVIRFLSTLDAIKLFHWKTTSYATHKATDGLHETLSSHVDKFVEVMLGKLGNRVDYTGSPSSAGMPVQDVSSQNQFNQYMKDFKCFLFSLDDHPGMATMKNADLFTIRDEMLATVNQFLYLQTLS